MAEQKTKATLQSVEDFIKTVEDEQMRDDCRDLVKLMKKVTGSPATMWGTGIIGFGTYHYKYDSGYEGDSCLTGFAPRKGKISLYLMLGANPNTDLLSKLGKHKASKGCVYIKKLEDINTAVLEKLVKHAVDYLKKKYPDKKK
jgi:hypothetical protein